MSFTVTGKVRSKWSSPRFAPLALDLPPEAGRAKSLDLRIRRLWANLVVIAGAAAALVTREGRVNARVPARLALGANAATLRSRDTLSLSDGVITQKKRRHHRAYDQSLTNPLNERSSSVNLLLVMGVLGLTVGGCNARWVDHPGRFQVIEKFGTMYLMDTASGDLWIKCNETKTDTSGPMFKWCPMAEVDNWVW